MELTKPDKQIKTTSSFISLKKKNIVLIQKPKSIRLKDSKEDPEGDRILLVGLACRANEGEEEWAKKREVGRKRGKWGRRRREVGKKRRGKFGKDERGSG